MDRIKTRKTAFQEALFEEDFPEEEAYWEFQAELQELFDTLTGDELVLSVIERVHHFSCEEMEWSIDMDFTGTLLEDIEVAQDRIREVLMERIAGFITDEHRSLIVCYHARGFSTADAVSTLIWEDSTMHRLAEKDAIGEKELHDLLLTRFAYLKPGTARWPEKKYGDVWREARAAYQQEMRGIPLTSPVEQIALLAKHAERISSALDAKRHPVQEMQSLTHTLVKTLESLQKLSVVERQAVDLSVSEFMAFLERLTLALETPGQRIALSGDTDALIEGLERLTLALKSSNHKAIAGEVEGVPTDADDGNSE